MSDDELFAMAAKSTDYITAQSVDLVLNGNMGMYPDKGKAANLLRRSLLEGKKFYCVIDYDTFDFILDIR